jgi:hypothetical protein
VAKFMSVRTTPLGKESPILIEYEAGWATGPVRTLGKGEKSLAAVENRTPHGPVA